LKASTFCRRIDFMRAKMEIGRWRMAAALFPGISAIGPCFGVRRRVGALESARHVAPGGKRRRATAVQNAVAATILVTVERGFAAVEIDCATAESIGVTAESINTRAESIDATAQTTCARAKTTSATARTGFAVAKTAFRRFYRMFHVPILKNGIQGVVYTKNNDSAAWRSLRLGG
jgi:hypothetical protein